MLDYAQLIDYQSYCKYDQKNASFRSRDNLFAKGPFTMLKDRAFDGLAHS